MATDTDHHHSYHKDWLCPELPKDDQDPEAVSISEILDHGSISFGRFASESLAWEKWSVFPNNRCQEELEKFKAPGLVAQKKAYFEEYYKRIRAMKGLQMEQQETTQPDSSQDTHSNIVEVANSVYADALRDETTPRNVSQIQTSDIVDKSEHATKELQSSCMENNDKAGMTEMIISLTNIEVEHPIEEASPSCVSSINRSVETSQQDSFISSKIKHIANKPNKHASVLKTKGTVTSVKSRSNLVCATTKDAAKPSEMPKPSPRKEIICKADNSLVSSKRSSAKVASNTKSNFVSSHRKITAAVSRDKLVSSASSIRGGQVKPSPSSQGLADKLQTSLPFNSRSSKSTSKEITGTGSVKNMAVDRRSCNGVARKSIELRGCLTRPKDVELENQQPRVMSINLPARNKSKQNFEVELGHRSYVKEGEQKEGKEKISAGLGRDARSPSFTQSSMHKAAKPKLVQKIAPWRSAVLTHDGREPRLRMPAWR